MAKYLKIFLFSFFYTYSFAQQRFIDSLRNDFQRANNDTARVGSLGALVDYYSFNQFDSSSYYSNILIDLSKKVHDAYGVYLGYFGLFHAFNCRGNYPKALEADLEMQKTAKDLKEKMPWLIAMSYYFQGVLFRETNDYANAINKFNDAIQTQAENKGDSGDMFGAYTHMSLIYRDQGKLDSALILAKKGYELAAKSIHYRKFFCLANAVLGNIYESTKDFENAEKYYRSGIVESENFGNIYFLARNYNFLSSLFGKKNNIDSCIFYARKSLQLCLQHNFGEYAYNASVILKDAFSKKNVSDSALKYIQIMLIAKDSVYSQSQEKKFQQVVFQEELQKRQLETERIKQEQKNKIYILSIILIFLLSLTAVFYRNNLQKQKANKQIEKSYKELKETQAQLIQSEKMASLGELTAGIAHEIQNPLNFVNNFSELNREMIDELQTELKSGNIDEARAISDDIKGNEEKISYHGKRADGIVKSMLQHSRSSTGVKEPTDINKLTDEYLRLAYHGFRAKEKDFKVNIETDFDDSIQKINIVPQDMGKVLLNLINNAFYAINEKKKINSDATYEPKVIVSTGKNEKHIFINVTDNGIGIPENIIDKIFQPFFTTKPTGQGTGLGLSLSYDIIKAQGGEIKVETKEKKETTFIIQFPYELTSYKER